jgi:methionyl-tRNA formyltransferase
MRIIFMGSPDFAIPSLDALQKSDHDVCAVVTQPDRPAGRGRKLRQSAVKKLAKSYHLPIIQPDTLRDESLFAEFNELKADLIVVAAYGQILPQRLLELPRYGCINVHASLLPRWRGAAPVQAAILEGDDDTGITIMKMDAGLDTGPILQQRSTPIEESETGGELEKRLAVLGGELLFDTIPAYVSGDVKPIEQDDSLATYAPMLKKKDGQIYFRQTAGRLARQVRAFEPWPSSFFFWDNLRIVVRAAHPHPHDSGTIGEVGKIDGLPAISTGSGSLILERIQPAGKREMSSVDFLNGSPDFIGSLITTREAG